MIEFFDFWNRPWMSLLIDTADILLVAVLLYRLLVLIKGTRGMQMSVGLGLVLVVYYAAKYLGFVSLYTILNNIVSYLVLIVVVIFQHDIRRALMRVGRRPFFRSERAERDELVIEETVRAVLSLAQKRIGALIVFERDAELNEFVQSGTLIDAAVTKELLYSIFIPSFENPLHDGATLLRDGRIWQAGAFLPLTSSTKLDRSVGTRHRAAIGLSEETDAVVIIVSEERGAISLCFNGNMVRDLEGASLREALGGLFYAKPKKRRLNRDNVGPGTLSSSPSVSTPPANKSPSQTPQEKKA